MIAHNINRIRFAIALCLGLALAALTGLTAPASAARHDLDLVSRADGAAGTKANNDAWREAISADGRFIAFSSAASNLAPGDDNGTSDVFVRDLQAGTTTLVSRAAGDGGDEGNDSSDWPAISADGRFVAFSSTASNLVPDDDNGSTDVFVRDLRENTTTLVSRADDATGAKGNDWSDYPAFSADGRFVAFVSDASNLDPDDGDTERDIYVRDLQANATMLVSRADGANGAKGTSGSEWPALSADGRYVVFSSDASNLVAGDDNDTADVFVRDLLQNTTTLVSRASGAAGEQANEWSRVPAISTDGRFVAFSSNATNLDPADADTTEDLFLRDLAKNTTTLVSRADGAAGARGNDESTWPVLSANGRYLAFLSLASNLVPGDDGDSYDLFVRDLEANTTTLVSRAAGAAGDKANNWSDTPAMSGDGRYVAFSSAATNLHPDDGDANYDVFRRDLLGSAPAAAADAYATIENTPLGVAAPGVLANDADADAEPVTAALVSSPTSGSLALNADGSFTYTPAANFSGSDSFGYSASDGLGSSAATVTITVHAAAPPPPPPASPPPASARQARCVVPNVKRKTLRQARRKLAARKCRLGKVTRAYSNRVRRGRVIAQSRRPGRVLSRATKVNVSLSRGARRR